MHGLGFDRHLHIKIVQTFFYFALQMVTPTFGTVFELHVIGLIHFNSFLIIFEDRAFKRQ